MLSLSYSPDPITNFYFCSLFHYGVLDKCWYYLSTFLSVYLNSLCIISPSLFKCCCPRIQPSHCCWSYLLGIQIWTCWSCGHEYLTAPQISRVSKFIHIKPFVILIFLPIYLISSLPFMSYTHVPTYICTHTHMYTHIYTFCSSSTELLELLHLCKGFSSFLST